MNDIEAEIIYNDLDDEQNFDIIDERSEAIIYQSSLLKIIIDFENLCMYLTTPSYLATIYKTVTLITKYSDNYSNSIIEIPINDDIYQINYKTFDNINEQHIIKTINFLVKNIAFT